MASGASTADTRRVSVLVFDEDERAAVHQLLGAGGPLIDAGAYVWGTADREALERLAEAGMLFNVHAPEPHAHGDAADTPSGAALEATSPSGAERIQAEPKPCSLVLAGPLTTEREEWLTARGVSIGRKLGTSTYVATVPTNQLAAVAGQEWLDVGQYGVRATIGDALLEMAMEPLDSPLRAQVHKEAALDADLLDDAAPPKQAIYDVRCHRPGQLEEVARLLEDDGRTLEVKAGQNRLRYWVEAGSDAEGELLLELGRAPAVELVERYVEPDFEVSYAVAALFGGSAPPPSRGRWTGAGQKIGIADSGIDADHPDFAGRLEVVVRVPPMSERDPKGHGTHVASIAAGSGAASGGELAGAAPGASLFVQSLADEVGKLQVGVGVEDLLREAYEAGVRIQNLSWGAAVNGRYTLDASDLDAFVREHPDYLIVVAAGNAGTQEEIDDGIGRIGLRSLASPASAKNCLTVGASCSPRADGPYASLTWRSYDGKHPPRRVEMANLPLTGVPDVVAALSSRRPSDDGRIKPDLVAPGVGIAAARSADLGSPRHPYQTIPEAYHFLSGTSMAAPLVAGAAAIVRQYLVDERGHEPSAALLKAILINGALQVTGEPFNDPRIGSPNFHQGFGRLNLSKAIPAADDADFALRFADVRNDGNEALHVDSNPIWRTSLRLESPGPLSITMTWMDPPGRGLQHGLDLVLISPTGAKIPGNSQLTKLPFETRDGRNNVQQIRVADAAPGPWHLQVSANNTHRGKQGFAVAIAGPIAP